MYVGYKVPIIVTVTDNRKQATVNVDIFSTIEKAEARFLLLCANMEISFKSGENIDWRVHKNNKTIFMEWKEVI